LFRAPHNPIAVYSTGYAILHPIEAEDAEFVFHAMTTHFVERQVAARVTGSNYPAISASDLAEIQIPNPSAAVKGFIVSMLQELANEEQQLEKLAGLRLQQKRGLMQKLLTGEWRVPPTADRLTRGNVSGEALVEAAE
jgi:type I restriction enzyme S subunit